MTALRIDVVVADITTLEVDAIVNAANTSLLGGGGVDGAIHRAAGPGLLAECRRLGGCETGDAKPSGGHALPARWVIHTVGPVWNGGAQDERALLASSHRRCLEVADEIGARSVAFPAISTGVYGVPKDVAAEISVAAIRASATDVAEILLVAFDEDMAQRWLRAIARSLVLDAGRQPPDGGWRTTAHRVLGAVYADAFQSFHRAPDWLYADAVTVWRSTTDTTITLHEPPSGARLREVLPDLEHRDVVVTADAEGFQMTAVTCATTSADGPIAVPARWQVTITEGRISHIAEHVDADAAAALLAALGG